MKKKAEIKTNKDSKKSEKSQPDSFIVTLEYEPSEDAEIRLLEIYKFLLGIQ